MALAGVIGPLGFVAAWLIAGALTPGYSPVGQAISRLAAAGAPRRGLMTAGLACFGVGVGIYAVELRRRLAGRAWIAAATSAVATLGVALFPLGFSDVVDGVHTTLAAVGYLALAATPVLAAPALAGSGRRRAAGASVAIGCLAAVCLAATVAGPAHGLAQRAGLGLVDAWLIAGAAWFVRARAVPAESGPGVW